MMVVEHALNGQNVGCYMDTSTRINPKHGPAGICLLFDKKIKYEQKENK